MPAYSLIHYLNFGLSLPTDIVVLLGPEDS